MNSERMGQFKDSWFDPEGNEYRAHMPVSYGAFLKEALKRAEQGKLSYPDLVSPRMREVIKELVYSRVEQGGIDHEHIEEKQILFALRDLSKEHAWTKDEDIDIDLVRAKVLEQLG